MEPVSSAEIDACIFVCVASWRNLSTAAHICGPRERKSFLAGKVFCSFAAQSCTVVMMKWFSSTRLETRTKESSTCASS